MRILFRDFHWTESVGNGTAQLRKSVRPISVRSGVNADKSGECRPDTSGRKNADRASDQDRGEKSYVWYPIYLVEQPYSMVTIWLQWDRRLDVLFNSRYYSYTIVGVYEYEESDTGFSSSSSEEYTETTHVSATCRQHWIRPIIPMATVSLPF